MGTEAKSMNVSSPQMGYLLYQLLRYEQALNVLIFSFKDCTVCLWNCKSGDRVVIASHPAAVTTVAHSDYGSDGANFIASGSADNSMYPLSVRSTYYFRHLYSAGDHAKIAELSGHTKGICKVRFRPTSYELVSSSDDKTLKIWNLYERTARRTLKGHKDGVCSVAYSNDGKTIVSGSYDNLLILWNADTGNQLGLMGGHTVSN